MFIAIDRNSSIPIKKQLYDALTYKILNKELERGHKMPSTRQLASQLNIARNTVTEIYDQLVAEAYLITHQGRGTFVAKVGNCKICLNNSDNVDSAALTSNSDNISLISGNPDLSSFPKKAWQSAYRSFFNKEDINLYAYGNTMGYQPFRKSIAKYLKHHKGICSSYQQIIITSGTKDALRLIALSLVNEYKNIQIEMPSADFIKEVFKSCGYNTIPGLVDNQGIVVKDLKESPPSLLYVSPAHQFPLGGTLPISRRQELIEFANAHNHIILEDDYDSEFRYKGAPVNSLYQLCSENVIHIGTFSKTLCPSLRLGYAVIPQRLLSYFKSYRDLAGNPPDTLNQAVLNDLITNGAYEKHIYKMTKVYKSKMKLVVNSLKDVFKDDIEINGCALGLHLSVKFKNITFTEKDKLIFRQERLDIDLENEYHWDSNKSNCNTLIVGFGHLSLDDITQSIKRLEKAIKIIQQ